MTKNDRANFGSKLGVILASAGSAVGLGNIWRFPYETGNHGGAAFILIYLACVLILGIPIMVSEFLIGRHSRANTAGAYQKLAPGTHWRWVGRMGVLAGFLILSYYSVVAGWTLEFRKSAPHAHRLRHLPEIQRKPSAGRPHCTAREIAPPEQYGFRETEFGRDYYRLA